MVDFWRSERIDRIGTSDASRPIVAFESDTGGFLFRSRELMLNGLALDLLRSSDNLPDAEFPDVSSLFPGLTEELGIFLLRWEPELDPWPDVDPTVGEADRLLGLAQGLAGDPDAVVVSPHYVLTGEPKYHGGPAGAPTPLAVTPSWASQPFPRPVAAEPEIAVLDTGIARQAPLHLRASTTPDPTDEDTLYVSGSTLASESGHGTFIMGLIERLAGGGVRIDPGKVLSIEGITDDATLGLEINQVAKQGPLHVPPLPPVKVVCLSLGTHTLPAPGQPGGVMPPALASALRALSESTVVIAAAGNGQDDDGNASDLKFWPAAGAGIVAVASVRRDGAECVPSTWSNYGTWVDVWTVGEDLTSTYVSGQYPIATGAAPLAFTGFAVWSGTSFATAVVAAEVVRLAKANQSSGLHAWNELRATLPNADAMSNKLTAAQAARVAGPARFYDPLLHGPGVDPAGL